MKPILIAAAVTFLGVSAAAPQTPRSPMREGRWEITVHMDMPGMPMKLPPQKVVQCITKKQLEDPGGAVPGGAVPGAPAGGTNPCKVTDHKVDGNKITWSMTCAEPQPMTGTGEIRVEGDTYTGSMKMTGPQGQMSMKYDAKRLGDCVE